MSNNTPGAINVLIVHYNTPELTSRLALDFPRHTPRGRTVSVYILDNSSAPENVKILSANIADTPNVTLTESASNVGYGEGVNLLFENIEVADSDILWVVNPDTQVTVECLASLECELDSGRFDVVSPLIYSGQQENSWIWYCGGSLSTRGLRVQHDLYGHQIDSAPREAFETEFVTGAAPMMSVATFKAVGGFPRDYFMYWEDVYFSIKARVLGFRLGVVPAARLWHAVGASSGSGQSDTYYFWTARNRFIFARDIGVPRAQLLFGHPGLESLRPVMRALLMERSGRLSKARAAIRGTIEGFKSSHRRIGSQSLQLSPLRKPPTAQQSERRK